MDKDKKEFGKWWVWVLMLVVLTVVVGAGLRFAGVFGERKVFENSYQYKAARRSEIATYEAQLAEIARKMTSNLDEETRANYEAQAAAIRIQLRVAKTK